MILEQRHNPQPATGPSLPRAYDPHSTFSITNGPILQPRTSSSNNNHNHHHHHHHHHPPHHPQTITNVTPTANGSTPTAPQPPIRPTEPFRSFAAANLAHHDGHHADPTDIWAALDQAWHDLGPAGQRPYEKVYEDQMRDYQAEKDEYDRGRRRGAAARGANGRDRESRAAGAAQGGGRSVDERARPDVEREGVREREGEGRRVVEDVEMEMDGAVGTGGGFTAVNG